MSAIEVVGLVAGMVAAFGSAASLYREWRKERRERDGQEANKRLKSLVDYSGPEIQGEYDREFRRLGEFFSRGDHVGQIALLQQLVVLQQTVISILSEARGKDALRNLVHPNHAHLYRSSSSAKVNTLSALGQQAQRLMQAAPIPSVLQPDQSSGTTAPFQKAAWAEAGEVPTPSLSSNSADNAKRQQTPEGSTLAIIVFLPKWSFNAIAVNKRRGLAPRCNWRYKCLSQERPRMLPSSKIHMQCFSAKFHAGQGGAYGTGAKTFRCFLCKTEKLLDWDQMVLRRDDHHTSPHMCGGTCGWPNCGKI